MNKVWHQLGRPFHGDWLVVAAVMIIMWFMFTAAFASDITPERSWHNLPGAAVAAAVSVLGAAMIIGVTILIRMWFEGTL